MTRLWIVGLKKERSYKTWLASLPSTLISKYQWGLPYIHTGVVYYIETGTTFVIEANAEGVVHSRYTNPKTYDLFYIDCTEEQLIAAHNWAHEQVGKPYDFLGLFAFLWRKDYQDDSKWFCSELCSEMCKQAGIGLFNHKIIKTWQVTPRMMLGALKGPVSPMEALCYESVHSGH